MPVQDDRPYLSDVINYDEDIAPHQFIKIFAGVGSGKNTFVDNLAKGNVFRHSDGSFVKKKYILLITSRRSKVNEQLHSDAVVYDPEIGAFDSPYADWFADLDPRYEGYYESPTMKLPDLDGWGRARVYRRTCVNTNAKIESNLRQHYTPLDATTHPWERFDMIIIDEAHALLADASYQSSPFYVRRLIEETLQKSNKCKVIVMTGSPQILNNQPLFANAHCIDMMDVCKNIRPNRIEFITKEQAKEKQSLMLLQQEPFVAFFNHIRDILSLVSDTPVKYHNSIVVSYSKKEKRTQLAESNPVLYQNMLKAEHYLAIHQKLPAITKAFLTTDKNKEGINIKNKDFHTMFVEAHTEIDIIQMVGRLRNPIQTLYIVIDSVPNSDLESRFEKGLTTSTGLIPAINTYFYALCKSNGLDLQDTEDTLRCPTCSNQEIADCMDYIHGKFPYLRYDYFTDQFVYYSERESSKAYYSEQHQIFNRAKYASRRLIQLANQWFPGIPCSVSIQLPGDTQLAVDDYLRQNHWLDNQRDIQDPERKEILENLNRITGSNSRQLKSLLRAYHYLLKTNGKKRTSYSTITRIT